MTNLVRWFSVHERGLVLSLVAIGVLWRGLLVAHAPPIGYVWDFYFEGVQVLARQGRLPVAADCWQCYHPPLFYLAGWPFFELGEWVSPASRELPLRLLSALSLGAAAITIWYGYRLLRLFGCRGASLVTGSAILFASPILFISADAPEADIVVTAILSAFVFYSTRAFARPGGPGTGEAVRLGAIAGLAAATKYSGLIAVAAAAILFIGPVVHTRGAARRSVAARGLLMVLLTIAIGGWKYLDNWTTWGTPLHANGSASEGLSLGSRQNRGEYDFMSVRLQELSALFGPRPPRGELTSFPVYRSVITSLHAQAWSDMSFFSVPSRHGDQRAPYPLRRVPVWLTMAVVVLGFVPEALALLGFVLTIRRRLFRPLALFSLLTIAAYVAWFLPQQQWALKTKYILCLLPVMTVYIAVALGWIWRRARPAGIAAGALVAALVVLAHVYQYAFAMGRL